MTPVVTHYTDPPEHAALYERIVHAIEPVSRAVHADPNFGARMARGLTDAGLVKIATEAHTALVAGGTEKWLPGIVEFAAGHMVGTGLVTDYDVQSFLTLLADPSFRYAVSLLVTAWGRRPA